MDGTAAQGQSEDGYLKVERSSGSGMELLFGVYIKIKQNKYSRCSQVSFKQVSTEIGRYPNSQGDQGVSWLSLLQ